jgi:hypothetical protein
VQVFLKAIDTVANLPDLGFAAIKVTALGNPQLLERMSAALVEIRSLFAEADTDGEAVGAPCAGFVVVMACRHGRSSAVCGGVKSEVLLRSHPQACVAKTELRSVQGDRQGHFGMYGVACLHVRGMWRASFLQAMAL